jgi:hypothetical protein
MQRLVLITPSTNLLSPHTTSTFETLLICNYSWALRVIFLRQSKSNSNYDTERANQMSSKLMKTLSDVGENCKSEVIA